MTKIGSTLAAIAAAALVVCNAAAANYPERPIRLIVPQAPGSASDTVARLIASALAQQLKQQIVVDNRPGGALMIGMEMTARATPDGYTIGYGPIGKYMTGTNIVHVPYKGGAAGITDLISGQVQLMMESLNSITPHAKSGRVRGLAVTGPKRSPALPEVLTVAEAGVSGYEATTWTGIVAPVGVPKAIVTRLNAELNKATASQLLKEKFAQIGSEAAGGTPEQFGELIRKESAKWADVVKRSGAKVD